MGYPIPPWRPRFRAACAVFLPSPSADHFRVRLILSCASLLLQSLSSHSRPRRSCPGHLPWASIPHRGAVLRSPLTRASQAHYVPSSTFLTSSTACSSTELRGFVSPRNHVQGSLFRGFPWQEAARARRPPLPSCRWCAVPAPSFTHGLQHVTPAFRALLRSPVRRKPWWFRPRPARSPRELLPSSGSPSHTARATFTALSDHGLSRPPSCCRCAT